MYTVILATVLATGGSTTPTWGGHRAHGCYGCYGCHGCHGCYGGCYGCWGCYGGCVGFVPVWNCCGNQGMPVYTKPNVPPLNPNPPVERLPGPPPVERVPNIAPPLPAKMEKEEMKAAPPEKKEEMKEEKKEEEKKEEEKKDAEKDAKDAATFRGPIRIYDYPAAKATVVVELPADAKLFLDGNAVPLSSARRTFETPPLKPGKTYAYTLRAEVVRDGKTLVDAKRVVFQAGNTVQVEFQELTARAAALGNSTARK
ncbi:MAG: TIGR03000 domain-containing protein [Planctomycetia bacterium]|nr:TIGR03000 domain-containing protein [Planctomycetia bacterium]